MQKSKRGRLFASPVGDMLFQSRLLRISSNIHLVGIGLKHIVMYCNQLFVEIVKVGSQTCCEQINWTTVWF